MADAVEELLKTFTGLHGQGEPTPHVVADTMRTIGDGLRADVIDTAPTRYQQVRDTHATSADAHADRHDVAATAVADTATVSVDGRQALDNTSSDYRAKLTAVHSSGVTDTPWGQTAGIDAAQEALATAADQITATVQAVQANAARILGLVPYEHQPAPDPDGLGAGPYDMTDTIAAEVDPTSNAV